MAHLGERLRQQRLARGVSLQHISEQTRIGIRYLEALEAGDFKQLPGAIFARSFVRQYVAIIGTDATPLEAELQQIFPSEDVLPSADFTSSTLTANLKNDTLLAANGPIWRRLPLTAISLVTALLVSSVLYVGWQRVVLISETSEQPPAIPISKAPAGKQPAVHADPPVSSPSVVPAAANSVPAAETPAKTSTELQAPPRNGGTAMAVRVVASEKTWVSIAANGRFLFSGILQPYEERTVTGVEFARMVVGNSTGVDIQADGRSIGPIGPQGSVRVVLLTPGNPPQIGEHADFGTRPQPQPPPEPDSRPDNSGGASTATKLD
jgi:cytoskeleton protein RodZ